MQDTRTTEEHAIFQKDFCEAVPTFEKFIGGNDLCFVRKRFLNEAHTLRPKVLFYELSHVKQNVRHLYKYMLLGAHYNKQYRKLYMSNCWMMRPDGSYFFVLALVRTKCVSPRYIKWVTYLTSLSDCTPNYLKQYDLDDMIDNEQILGGKIMGSTERTNFRRIWESKRRAWSAFCSSSYYSRVHSNKSYLSIHPPIPPSVSYAAPTQHQMQFMSCPSIYQNIFAMQSLQERMEERHMYMKAANARDAMQAAIAGFTSNNH